ncbi:MAG: YdeI/OmpD-associated family protein [Armatimonadota bacterium]
MASKKRLKGAVKLGDTLYVSTRKAWRDWLQKHHAKEKEIWLVCYNKASGKPRIPYNDSVEEALCFGWIDSTVKNIDQDSFAQRFSPRRPSSRWSEMNKERVRRLSREGKMTSAGLAAAGALETFVVPSDILKRLKADKRVWRTFQQFPGSYKRIRIGWIDSVRKRPDEFEKRLRYFLKMTAQNKRFGMVQ